MAEYESTAPPLMEAVESPEPPEIVLTPVNDEREILVEAVDLLVQIGGLLLQNGAHAEYVEASLERLEAGLNIDRIDVIVMSRSILLTATHRNLHHTRLARLPIVGVNLSLLSEAEHLLQRFEQGGMTAMQLAEELQRIVALPPHYTRRVNLTAIGLGCAAFCHLFGGDGMAMAVTGVAAATAAWVRMLLTRRQVNYFLVVLFTALTASLLAGSAVWLSETPQSALTAAVILLVPGASLINASIDILHGHIFSGMSRITISLVVFFGIALGLGAVVQLLRVSL